MNITLCPCDGKRNVNCFPDNTTLCKKNILQNNMQNISDEPHRMGITYFKCKNNDNQCNKCVAELDILNFCNECEQPENLNINNVSRIDGNRLLVCASKAKYPLWSYNLDNCGNIKSGPQMWKNFMNKNILFVNKLFDGYGLIPTSSFQLIFFKECECDYKRIKFECTNSFSKVIINVILNQECFTKCYTKDDFKFVGFFVKGNFIFYAVQLMTNNKMDKKLYLVRSSFNSCNYSVCNDVVLVAKYNLFNATCNLLCEKEALKLVVTGLTNKGNDLFILLSICSNGYLFNTVIPNVSSCDNTPEPALNYVCGNEENLLGKNFRGVTSLDNGQLFIISDKTECNNKCETNICVVRC